MLTFSPGGALSQTISVATTNDTLNELSETLYVNLTNAAGGTITASQGTGTIYDNDAEPSLTIEDITVNESDGTAELTLVLSALSGRAIDLSYYTSDGTASSGSDYTPVSTNVTIPAGTPTKKITVPILSDTRDEANETFWVHLSNATGVTIVDNQAQVMIEDDDPMPTVSISGTRVDENDDTLIFAVELSNASDHQITVNYQTTTGGTATAGSDYTATSGTLTFLPGETSKNISVSVHEDSTDETDETIIVALSSPVYATLDSPAEATGTIDDDDGPVISIANASGSEGDSVTFTVSLSAISPQDVIVSYSATDGTAAVGTHYTAAVPSVAL
jgi:hypothetical protein